MGNITKQLRFICFYIACFLCIGGIKAQQQLDPQRTNIALPITKTYNDSTKVHLFNLGIFNNINLLKGVQIGVIHADVHQDMKGLNIGGLVSLVRQDAKGMTFGGLLNGVGNDMKGLQLSPVSNVAGRARGVQLSGMSNISLNPLRGLQLSTFTNISSGVDKGAQISALVNVASHTVKGFQLSTYNYADTLSGAQVGLINVTQGKQKGWQVGLMNICQDSTRRKIGLINISPTTKIDFLLYAGNASLLNAAMRFRNKNTYSIVGLGTPYLGFDKDFSGALYYRIGRYASLSPRLTLSADVGFYHIETFKKEQPLVPARLFSLQTKVNLDYQFTKQLGAFVSLGYGHTRYYKRNTLYKNQLIGEIGLSLSYTRNNHADHKELSLLEDILTDSTNNDIYALPPVKRPWVAAAQTAIINVGVFSWNRFHKHADYSYITLNSVWKNLRSLPVWDNDPFQTNLYMHPYHGNTYFNAARSNGMSFWQSYPYALGGSLMWEYFGENEPPALNDLIATSMGGTCLGEVAYRISNILLNDKSRGFRRVLREAGAFIINPVRGVNRLVRGESWQVKQKNYLYHDINRFPLNFRVTVGNRYLADDNALFRGEHNPYVNFFFEYGDIFNDKENKPFDYFVADVTMGFSSNQPRMSGVHLLGRLWTAPVVMGKKIETEFGVYQHFNYYDSSPVKDGSNITPYLISEAVGVGPGIVYRIKNKGNLSRLEQHVYSSLILLGGTKSDYYNQVAPRDYNMGMGYSIKVRTILDFPRLVRFALKTDFYHIFTLKGYEDKDLTGLNQLHFNVQGDRSHAALLVVSPMFSFKLKGPVSANLSGSFYHRYTRYKYHDNVWVGTYEVNAGISCKL